MKTVIATGTFDFLHLGHIKYLKQAKSYGDRLVVIVSSDEDCKRRGKIPCFSEDERKELIDELQIVDRSFVGSKENVARILEKIRPNVICLGYDVPLDGELKKMIENFGTKITRADKHDPDRCSCSKLKSFELPRVMYPKSICKISKF